MRCRAMIRLPVLLAAMGAALILAAAAPAWALYGDTAGAFGLDGSVRTTAGMMNNRGLEALAGGHDVDTYSQTTLRLTAQGKPWTRLAYEVHMVGAYTHSSARQGGGGGGMGLTRSGGKSRYRALNSQWEWYEHGGDLGILWWDRANCKLSLDWADITVGRQAITFGKAYFWNPLDVFLPFDPRQFDREYKAGVDGLRFDFYLGDFSGITLIGVLGRELDAGGDYRSGGGALHASWYGSAALARAYTSVGGWDLAVQGGKVYGGYQLGAGTVGEIGPLEIRAEGAYLWADGRRALPEPYSGDIIKDHLTMVVGVGHRFENSLTLEAEYLYNGAGDTDHMAESMARFSNGAILHLGRHLLGATASYEITPLATGRLAAIYSLSDNSYQIQPTVTVSVGDNMEMLFGASWGFGEKPSPVAPAVPSDAADPIVPAGPVDPGLKSEFGSYADFYYFEFKLYF